MDEFPFLNAGQTLQLQEGMVIALEPKVDLPRKGRRRHREHPRGHPGRAGAARTLSG
ncbi:MAG: hypothetical protein M0C28_46990 [Candidatus Moduliflexus flocculans]|nr:hypothetical protein [Candidatus Moduliflexus flocculans]